MPNVKLIISVISILCVTAQNIFGQELRDDTIYTSFRTETNLYFHDKITFCNYTDPSGYASFITKRQDETSVGIEAKVENAQAARLCIIEGKRTHIFILAYKAELSLQERVHDFEDLKILKAKVALLEKKKSSTIGIPTPPTKPLTSAPAVFSDSSISNQPEKVNTQKDVEFNVLVKTADANFRDQSFTLAQQDYLRAEKLRPADPYVKKRLEETKQRLLGIAKQKESKDRDERYTDNLKRGDQAINEMKFEEARAAFAIALDIKPLEKYPALKIREIDATIAKQEEEKKSAASQALFDEEVKLGNEAYAAGNFEIARPHYLSAIKIKKDPVAEGQIRKIDAYKRDSLQTLKNIELARAREKANSEKYNIYKDKGDKAFNEQDYVLARNFYNQALTYQQEKYAIERLAEIKNKIDAINAEKERKRQIVSLVIKGAAAAKNNDYRSAGSFYNDALKLDSGNTEVLAKLEEINKKLEEIQLEKERNDRYDTAISRASRAFADQAYNNALGYFKEASSLKPEDAYSKKQIDIINTIFLGIEERKKREEELARRNEIRTLKTRAYDATQRGDLDSAIGMFKKVLTLNPEQSEANFVAKALQNIDLEKQRIASRTPTKQEVVIAPPKNKREARERQKEEERKKILAEARKKKPQLNTQPEIYIYETPPAAIVKAKTEVSKTSTRLQQDAIPYGYEQLIKKFPDTNFSEPPAGQTYDATDRKNRPVNYEASKRLLSDTSSSLNISDRNNSIEAICKSISFNGNNVFIKILIINNSFADFLTGKIQLTILKKNGTEVNLNQRFISDFPIVLPQKEFPLVYVAASPFLIESTDTLIMQVNDRSNKIKLQIKIPGCLYNSHKTASL